MTTIAHTEACKLKTSSLHPDDLAAYRCDCPVAVPVEEARVQDEPVKTPAPPQTQADAEDQSPAEATRRETNDVTAAIDVLSHEIGGHHLLSTLAAYFEQMGTDYTLDALERDAVGEQKPGKDQQPQSEAEFPPGAMLILGADLLMEKIVGREHHITVNSIGWDPVTNQAAIFVAGAEIPEGAEIVALQSRAEIAGVKQGGFDLINTGEKRG